MAARHFTRHECLRDGRGTDRGMRLAELVDDGLGDGVECGENIASSASIGFKAEKGNGAAIEEVLEVIDGGRVWQVSLVVLQDDGEAVNGAVVEAEIGLKALKGLQIIPLAVHLGVGNKDDTIGLAQNELEGGVVGNLAGDGVEVEGGFVARNGIGFDAEEVEEEGSILCSGEGNEIAAAARIELGVDLLNVGGLTAQWGAAIDDLKTDGAFVVVDTGHGGRGEIRWLVQRRSRASSRATRVILSRRPVPGSP